MYLRPSTKLASAVSLQRHGALDGGGRKQKNGDRFRREKGWMVGWWRCSGGVRDPETVRRTGRMEEETRHCSRARVRRVWRESGSSVVARSGWELVVVELKEGMHLRGAFYEFRGDLEADAAAVVARPRGLPWPASI